jgi:Ca2+-binding RTX toxin-like protein
MKTFQRLMAFGVLTVILFSVVTAIAATNTIPVTLLDHKVLLTNLNDLKPSACGGISVTNLITGTGTIIGTEANDLILASSAADTIDGLGGNDCIVGGGESDTCFGGLGSDIFVACEDVTQ